MATLLTGERDSQFPSIAVHISPTLRSWCTSASRSRMAVTEASRALASTMQKPLIAWKGWPCLTHQMHVWMILEATPLKEGSGRELHCLHDTVQQHLRALKVMDYEPSGPYITSMLELKLDTKTMFKWQKFSQDSTDVPHHLKLLEFYQPQGSSTSEVSISVNKRSPLNEDRLKRSTTAVASFAASITDSSTSLCVLWQDRQTPPIICLWQIPS